MKLAADTEPEVAGRCRKKRVCIVGLGYIGLPTAAVLADHGYEVIGCDVRPGVVETINDGRIHIVEPGLEDVVRRVVDRGNLTAQTAPCEADIFFLCVPTPITEEHRADLSYVEAASKAIQPYVRQGNVIILESTSPPKTTTGVVVPNAVPEDLTVGDDVFVAHCPERVLPGKILEEVIHNDRIVGGVTTACTEKVVDFYRTFAKGEILETTAVTAETTKLVENAYRDVNIAFANELSMLADDLGADPFEVIKLANHHPRVNILNPGPGVGGHCISVDPWFLVEASPERTPLIRTAREVNDAKPQFVVEQVKKAAAQLENPVIGCLGLAYKADVDDFRESPSVEIAVAISAANVGTTVAYDPYAVPGDIPNVTLVTLDQLREESDILVLLTDHAEFRDLSNTQLFAEVLIDTRGYLSTSESSASATKQVSSLADAQRLRHKMAS